MRNALSLVLAALTAGSVACSKPASAPAAPAAAAASPATDDTASPASTAPASSPAAASDVEARRKQLNDLIHEAWEYRLKQQPVFASILGDLRYNDLWSDDSEAATAADLAQAKIYLAKFQAIDTRGLSDQDVLNQRLIVRQLRQQLDDARFEDWLMPFDQMGGVHINLPQLAAILRFQTVKDYEDYIKRLDTMPKVIETHVALARAGLAKGLMPPRFLLERVVVQATTLSKMKVADSPFAQPVKKFPSSIPSADQQRLRKAVLAAVKDKVTPAYVAMTTFLRDEYAPKGRKDIGEWSLPDGQARYIADVKDSTTTDMTPDEIHQLGLSEVARIEVDMAAIAKKLGFKDLATFQAKVRKDKAYFARSRKDILDRYQRYTDGMYAELPKLFGRLPKGTMEIKPVEAYRERDFAGAEYHPGTPDGSRPGAVLVNTGDPTKRSTLDIESTAYHEGVPGHHLQIAIAQELPELPPFRQQAFFGAFIEGWALYAERLGKEIGFYKDPYSEYGHLQDEMLRAIRLVVDTGIHSKKWTRDQVVTFFHDHSTLDEPTVQNETDRYIVWPGQALSYKVGQLTILRLRGKAQDALGAGFDIRAFHDEILGGGALPLDVLEARIDRWIANQKQNAKN